MTDPEKSKPQDSTEAEVEQVDDIEVEPYDEPDVQADVVVDPDDTYAEGVDLPQGEKGSTSGNAEA